MRLVARRRTRGRRSRRPRRCSPRRDRRSRRRASTRQRARRARRGGSPAGVGGPARRRRPRSRARTGPSPRPRGPGTRRGSAARGRYRRAGRRRAAHDERAATRAWSCASADAPPAPSAPPKPPRCRRLRRLVPRDRAPRRAGTATRPRSPSRSYRTRASRRASSSVRPPRRVRGPAGVYRAMDQVDLDRVARLLEAEGRSLAPPPGALGRVMARARTARPHPRTSWISGWPRPALAVIAVALLLVGLGGGAYASTPGEPLFGVQRALDEAYLALPRAPQDAARASVGVAERRVAQATSVRATVSVDALRVTLDDALRYFARARATLARLPEGQRTQAFSILAAAERSAHARLTGSRSQI